MNKWNRKQRRYSARISKNAYSVKNNLEVRKFAGSNENAVSSNANFTIFKCQNKMEHLCASSTVLSNLHKHQHACVVIFALSDCPKYCMVSSAKF